MPGQRKPRPGPNTAPTSTAPRTMKGRRDYDTMLVACLVRGMALGKAAEAIGVNVRTVRRRLAEPEFRDQLEAAKSNVIAVIADDVMLGAAEAIQVLRDIQKDPDQPAAARVTAATRLTELALAPRYEIETTTTTVTVSPEAAGDKLRRMLDRVRKNMDAVPNLIEATATDTTEERHDAPDPEAPLDPPPVAD